ncbi:MAG: hypothetical protein KGK07_07205 [Chloroflexota bacterium]|nr:hypothetical protein [Chloroflexota bacterium]
MHRSSLGQLGNAATIGAGFRGEIDLRGDLRLVHRSAGGVILEERDLHNTVVTAGRNWLASYLAPSPPANMGYIGYGSGGIYTTLNGATLAAATSITLTSGTGTANNDYLLIDPNNTDPIARELSQISSGGGTTSITLATALRVAHTNGVGVADIGTGLAKTALNTEIASSRQSATVTASTNVIQYVATFTNSGAQVTVNESAVFNASSAGTMLCYVAFGGFTLATNDSLQITWKVTLGVGLDSSTYDV